MPVEPTKQCPFRNVENTGLTWIGVPEKCDCCQVSYPMAWIKFDGKRFLCISCDYEVNENENAYIEECDLCHMDFPLIEMTLNYNQILCNKCASDDASKKEQALVEQEGPESIRRKYD